MPGRLGRGRGDDPLVREPPRVDDLRREQRDEPVGYLEEARAVEAAGDGADQARGHERGAVVEGVHDVADRPVEGRREEGGERRRRAPDDGCDAVSEVAGELRRDGEREEIALDRVEAEQLAERADVALEDGVGRGRRRLGLRERGAHGADRGRQAPGREADRGANIAVEGAHAREGFERASSGEEAQQPEADACGEVTRDAGVGGAAAHT